MKDLDEISGVMMGRIVDEYMRQDPFGFFTGKQKDDRKLWKRSYRHIMQVLRVCSRIESITPGKMPRYSKNNVNHILPDVYTDWCEWQWEISSD